MTPEKLTAFEAEAVGGLAVGDRLTRSCLSVFGAPVHALYGPRGTYWFDFQSRYGTAWLTSVIDASGRWRYHLRADPGPLVTVDEWEGACVWLASLEFVA